MLDLLDTLFAGAIPAMVVVIAVTLLIEWLT